MNFERKRKRALELLAKTGIGRSSYEPPGLRVLWRIGIKLPPPHFTPFIPTALGGGLVFGVLWGVSMWLFMWSDTAMDLGRALWSSGLAGFLFGVFMAIYYANGRHKHKLPTWSSLGDEVSRP